MKTPLPDRKRLVEDLVSARLRARVSVCALARRAGVSDTAIHNIEKHGAKPSEEILRAYAALCNLDGDALALSWDIVPEWARAELRANPRRLELVRVS